MEGQPTILLIKKSSFLDSTQLAGEQRADTFCSKFGDPMPDETISGYRAGTYNLNAVAVQAEV
jgi:hypothetical protein